MIRINLLPVREARRKADLRQQMMMIGASAVAALVLAAGAQQFVRSQISATNRRVEQLDKQLAQFKPQQEQVDAYKAKKADIEQKLAVIARLEQSRSGPVRILDELASRTPERVWLTNMVASGGKIELKGMSLDNELVAQFLTEAMVLSAVSGVLGIAAGILMERLRIDYASAQAALRTQASAEGKPVSELAARMVEAANRLNSIRR